MGATLLETAPRALHFWRGLLGWIGGFATLTAAVAILAAATAVASSGTLLLIMSLVGTERQGDALTTIVIIGWSMLGGAFASWMTATVAGTFL